MTMQEVHANALDRKREARKSDNIIAYRYWRHVQLRAEIALALESLNARSF